MDDIKNKDQANESTNDYQKILDEYAASIKPEDSQTAPENKAEEIKNVSLKEVSPSTENLDNKTPQETKNTLTDDVEKNINNTPEPQKLKSINSPQLESPIHPSLAANLETEDDYQKTFNQPEKITPVDSIKNEFTPPVSTQAPEVEKTPEQIKAEINKILSDDTPTSQPESVSSPKSGSNFFRTLFIISLLIFFSVAAILAYTLLNDNSPASTDNGTTKLLTPTETPDNSIVCELNGQTYKAGESFPSADGCNTCTCESVDVIACTEKACAGVTTIPATKSATTTPAKTTTTPTKTTITPKPTVTSSTKTTITPTITTTKKITSPTN